MTAALRNLALSESGFLFDPSTGHTYSLNATGAFLLRQLVEGRRPAELAALVVERFETDEETAGRDCEQFLLQIGEMGLVDTSLLDTASPDAPLADGAAGEEAGA